jgi:hypothetical protein
LAPLPWGYQTLAVPVVRENARQAPTRSVRDTE